jgi:hypothetical protein
MQKNVIFPQDHKTERDGRSLKQSPCLCFEPYNRNIYVIHKFFLDLFLMQFVILERISIKIQ